MKNFKANKYSPADINKAIAKIIKKNNHQPQTPNATKILSDNTKINNFLNYNDYGKLKDAFSKYNKNSYSNGISTTYLPINIGTSKGPINPNNNYKKAGNSKTKSSVHFF